MSVLVKPPLPVNKPFGESRRWGDLRDDLSTRLLGSGKAERLRQKASRGKPPLVVAADTGLTSGEGVIPAMIGGRVDKGRGWSYALVVRRAATISRLSARYECEEEESVVAVAVAKIAD